VASGVKTRGCISLYDISHATTPWQNALVIGLDTSGSTISNNVGGFYAKSVNNSGISAIYPLSPPPISINQNAPSGSTTFYYYACTIDTTGTTFYVNNSPGYITTNYGLNSSNTYAIRTTDITNANISHSGLICDLRIYNRVLTSTEIMTMYNNRSVENIYIP
jgi:hypothetical protein